MQRIWAEKALLGDTWHEAVRIDVSGGRIVGIESGAEKSGQNVGVLVPAPVNCHSHAFQRAMAGLTEARGPKSDSFWTWRELMFRFLDQLTPEQIEAIAALAQMEMLEAGYGASVEFHYLHHQPGGVPYDDLSELSQRIVAAAHTSGIGLTLLPVQYQYGGCDRRALGPGQIRFGNDLDQYTRLVEGARAAIKTLPEDCHLGTSPHSLRAVAPEDLTQIAALAEGGPVHMHLAEQIPEVDEVHAAWGARPVEWALDNIELNERWCLIHCTQMQPHETEGLARTGAVAGLCPLTEASLGDGTFDGVRWLESGGKIAVGSDSNIRISLAEEIRQLDTSQRLRDHSRAALATPQRPSGRRLFEDLAIGGAQSAGRGSGKIELDAYADLLALDASHPDLVGLSGDTTLDTFAFAGGNDMVTDVWSAGRHVVKEGRHIARTEIVTAYTKAVTLLRNGL